MAITVCLDFWLLTVPMTGMALSGFLRARLYNYFVVCEVSLGRAAMSIVFLLWTMVVDIVLSLSWELLKVVFELINKRFFLLLEYSSAIVKLRYSRGDHLVLSQSNTHRGFSSSYTSVSLPFLTFREFCGLQLWNSLVMWHDIDDLVAIINRVEMPISVWLSRRNLRGSRANVHMRSRFFLSSTQWSTGNVDQKVTLKDKRVEFFSCFQQSLSSN